ncbi:MAG: right-handed parallel beta-helix repeat-containing protein [Candidatus Cloacimonetes bacterium]|nr:right-handed parallel beta-helix repeat-containing protein [Candidatus Cloacimonadota bacterium]
MKNLKQFFAIFIIMLLSNFVITNISFAQTHIPGGDVSGTWTIEGSPYIIEGHISVPIDSTLIIEPGVNIFFPEQNHFRVYGRLLAIGTESDTISFTASDTTDTFAGLYFCETDTSFQDSSKLKYCRFDPGCVGFSNSSRAIVKNCIVTNGYGIGFNNSSPTLIDVTISNNTSEGYGGGVSCTDSSNPSLVNVTVVGNNSGGICCSHNSNPTLEQVTIADNIGVGIGCIYSSSPILNNVTIVGNDLGITCHDGSSPVLDSVIINNNERGVSSSSSNPILTNVIIKENQPGGGIAGSGNIILRNVIISNNANTDIAAMGSGGGLQIGGNETNIDMVNVLIANNYASNVGGAICATDGPCLNMTNVTISNNSADECGGGIFCQFDCSITLRNSIVWDNTNGEIILYGYGNEATINYSDICGGWQGEGNIDVDPLFADTLYHLSEDSPCIDAGNPDTMYYDQEDPNNPGYALYPAMGTITNDMGAYGGHGYYEPPYGVNDEIIPNQEIKIINYPNPFHTTTTISFSIPKDVKSPDLKIYNINGQLVKNFELRTLNSELNNVVWYGKDERGKQLTNGIYLYKLSAGMKSITKKMLLMR